MNARSSSDDPFVAKLVPMIPHRIEASQFGVKGKVMLMADPNAPTVTQEVVPDIHDAAGVLLLCHPDDEQWVRDVIAREQEAPKDWRDWQRLLAILNRGGR